MPSTPILPTDSDDIAVVGLGCLFPGAPDVGTFWRNIVAKVSAITSPPPEAWSEQQFFDPSSGANDRVYCRKGGYLGSLAYFDPLDHGIMPRAVEGGEPDQWLALHVARQALRDAGLEDASAYRERAALILGKGTYANRGTLSVIQHALIVDYTIDLLKTLQPALTDEDLRRIRADLKRRLPRFDSETAPALIPNVTVGRIANRLDIMGPSYTIDAACASSLVAIDIAIKGLRHGEYDLALVGGLQVATPLPVLSLFCQLQALSASERIRPFDEEADGTLLSEGIGMAVLKRRSQAERDGDRIYAFVKGSGVASDGRGVGVLAPRPEGEVLALRRAYGSAGVDPRTVGLIEAHGTGTLVGDAVEVESLGRLFGERGAAPRVALGSVKSMIGHTMPAAGMAGFIKAVLSLYYKTLPPTINVTTPSPRLKIERTPFYINSETRPWVHGDPQYPRRAGINAFGFGGINAHVVVEEAPAVAGAPTHDTAWDSEVCLFSGDSRAAVMAQARDVSALLARQPATRLMDLASSLAAVRSSAAAPPVTLGIVARSTEDLARKIERALARLADPACRRLKESSGLYYFDEPLARAGKLAFVFPGEGAQYVNMLDDLCRYFPEVRACFDAMDRVLFEHPRGFRLSERVFPPPPFTDAERQAAEQALWQMDVAVEAVVTANAAMSTLLGTLGIVPDAMLGHSSGDYSAIRAAGMVDEARNDQRIVELNDQHRGAEDTGEMPQQTCLFAVAGPRARVEQICAAVGANASVAMDNCRHQVVIAIDPAHAGALESALQDACLLYERLAFDRPYHTAQFQPFAEKLRPLLNEWIVRGPALPLYSCTNVGLYPDDVAQARQLAFDHWVQPVEFRRTIEKMWDDGVRLFVEAGPRGNLTAFIDDVLVDRAYAAIPANVSRRSGLQQLHHLLAQLAAHGVSLRLDPLYARRQPVTIQWDPAAPRPSARPVLGRVKLATGAPEMRLSPELVELIVSRGAGAGSATGRTPPESAAPPATSVPATLQATRSSAAVPSTPVPEANPDMPMRASRTVPGPPSAPSASRVMAAYLATMERLLSVEQSMMEQRFAGASAVLTVAEAPDDLLMPLAAAPRPLIDVVTADPTTLTARCTLDLDHQPFLRDHTLGRDVSADDPDLTGFAIVPFTAL
ncbi:MAG: beta-ketoacyl synthase N-terminal-like domain-containing protein, partial [Vicinamibacterales bacterium]